MPRYLVTGGSGRLGRSVVTALVAAGHEVVSADRVPTQGLPARQLTVDLARPGAIGHLVGDVRPDSIVHLAGVPAPGLAPDRDTFLTNTSLALDVLTAAAAEGVGSVLVASSPTVLGYGAPGWVPDRLPLDEGARRAPWHTYALSKQAIEDLVAMAVRNDPDGPRLGVFRPCFVVTPEEWAGAPTQQGHTIVERLNRPELAVVSLFNYVDARDAGDFVARWLAAARDLPNGAVFFVGAEDSLVREPVGEALARLLPDTAGVAAGLEPRQPVFSCDRAASMLGWRPARGWRTELRTPARATRG